MPTDSSLNEHGMEHMRRSVAFVTDGYPVAAQRWELDHQVPLHSHDFAEIAIVVGGEGDYVMLEGSRPLRPGMVVAVRPGQLHGYAGCHGAYGFNLFLGPELLDRELAWTLDHPELAQLLLRGGMSTRDLTAAELERVVGWLGELVKVRAYPATPAAALALGLAGCVLGGLAACEYEVSAPRRAISPVVRHAIRLLGDHPARDWQVNELAHELHVSPAHLHRQFRAEVGAAPMAWLASTRAEHAATLLMQTDLPVAEVGRRVGWADANYFSRRFRSLIGTTPTEYRQRLAG